MVIRCSKGSEGKPTKNYLSCWDFSCSYDQNVLTSNEIWEQIWGQGLGGVGWQEAQHDPAMCVCSPESQPYPGLHQKKCDQQVEGGDSPPLLCSHETPLGYCIQFLRAPLGPHNHWQHGYEKKNYSPKARRSCSNATCHVLFFLLLPLLNCDSFGGFDHISPLNETVSPSQSCSSPSQEYRNAVTQSSKYS